MTVDAPGVMHDGEAMVRLGRVLWSTFVASATSVDTSLENWGTVVWKESPFPYPSLEPGGVGSVVSLSGAKDRSAVLVLQTGHLDSLGSRRMYLAGTPRSWVSGLIVKDSGMRELEGLAQSMLMGVCGDLTGAPITWLLAYPNRFPSEAGNPWGVGFRRVRYVVPCRFVARPPDEHLLDLT